MEERTAQLVIVPALNFNLTALGPTISEGVGGVLFLGNAAPPADLPRRVSVVAAMGHHNVRPFIMADEEGGGIQRLAGLVDRFPWARTMGSTMNPSQVESLAARVGAQLRAAGVDVDLGPVLDVDSGVGPNSRNPDGSRAFGGTADVVTAYGTAFLRGLSASQVLGVVKHFPGLGSSTGNTDDGSANTQPIGSLRRLGLVPFAAAIQGGARAVMVSNARVPGLTDGPASLSSQVMRQLLREELGFKGLVITDSLSTGAISSTGLDLSKASVAAIAAGADQVMFGSTLNATELALLRPASVKATTDAIVGALVRAVQNGTLPEERLNEAVASVLVAKGADLCTQPK